MASSKVKFKVSIKELAIEFEGDHETARSLQGRVANTLESLADLSGEVIDVEHQRHSQLVLSDRSKTEPQKQTQTRSAKRKRSAKPFPEQRGEAVGIVSSDDGNQIDKTTKVRRSKSETCRAQLMMLLQEDFFSQLRTAEDIKQKLSKKGRNFRSNHIAADLLSLTKKNYLVREKNEENKWIYSRGSNDDYSGIQESL